MISHFNEYATTSFIGMSENPRYKYQVAPDMAMTVRIIMILLYGAGGEPGRGEIPMKRCSTSLPMYFLQQGVLRTNIAKITYDQSTRFGLYIASYIRMLNLTKGA
jgi:hypothetical protein